MRSIIIMATAALLTTGAFAAQGQNNADSVPGNPAVKTTTGNNPGAPVAGANSFTMAEAKSRIESRGYSNVTRLAKDQTGVWRGQAQKDGKPVNVGLDYEGNVVAN
jgi:hypothetical protein